MRRSYDKWEEFAPNPKFRPEDLKLPDRPIKAPLTADNTKGREQWEEMILRAADLFVSGKISLEKWRQVTGLFGQLYSETLFQTIVRARKKRLAINRGTWDPLDHFPKALRWPEGLAELIQKEIHSTLQKSKVGSGKGAKPSRPTISAARLSILIARRFGVPVSGQTLKTYINATPEGRTIEVSRKGFVGYEFYHPRQFFNRLAKGGDAIPLRAPRSSFRSTGRTGVRPHNYSMYEFGVSADPAPTRFTIRPRRG